MSFLMFLRTGFEIFMFVFVVWGIFNEDKFIRFEKGIKAHFRRKRIKIVEKEVGIRN